MFDFLKATTGGAAEYFSIHHPQIQGRLRVKKCLKTKKDIRSEKNRNKTNGKKSQWITKVARVLNNLGEIAGFRIELTLSIGKVVMVMINLKIRTSLLL